MTVIERNRRDFVTSTQLLAGVAVYLGLAAAMFSLVA